MAGDWIKFRCSLWDDPRVRVLSRKCPSQRGHVIGALVRLWSLADQFARMENGHGVLDGFTPEDINDEVGIPNFVESLPECWCQVRDGVMYLPDYQEHNGSTAKSRAVDSKRKRTSRKRPNSVRKMSEPTRTKLGPEKRREEKSKKPPPTPPRGGGVSSTTGGNNNNDSATDIMPQLSERSVLRCGAFEDAWVRWVQHHSEMRDRLTTSTVRSQLAKLDELGNLESAVAMIDYSIGQGWKGLFPPPDNGDPGPVRTEATERRERHEAEIRERELHQSMESETRLANAKKSVQAILDSDPERVDDAFKRAKKMIGRVANSVTSPTSAVVVFQVADLLEEAR